MLFFFKGCWATAVTHAPICAMANRASIRVTTVWYSEESRIVDWLNDDYQPDMEVQEDSDDFDPAILTCCLLAIGN